MPFGVKVSQDIFQRKLDEIPSVAGIADDILVFGSTDIEQDQVFINILETCRKNNVGLNSEKLQFKQEKINFYGHTQKRESSLLKTNSKQSRTLKFQ